MTITSYARLMLLSQRQVTCQALSPSGARFSRRRSGSPVLAVLAWHHPDKRKEARELGRRCAMPRWKPQYMCYKRSPGRVIGIVSG